MPEKEVMFTAGTEQVGQTIMERDFSAARRQDDKAERPGGGTRPARTERSAKVEIPEGSAAGLLLIKYRELCGSGDIEKAVFGKKAEGVTEKGKQFLVGVREIMGENVSVTQIQKAVKKLEDNADRINEILSEPEPKVRTKRKTKEEIRVEVLASNKAAEADMKKLFRRRGFKKQTKEEFEAELRELRLGNKLQNAEAKRDEVAHRFEARIQEIEAEIDRLKDSADIPELDAKGEKIFEEIAELSAEHDEAIREVKKAELDIRLEEYLDAIRVEKGLQIEDVAAIANDPKVELSELLSIRGGKLTDEVLQKVNDAVRSGDFTFNNEGELVSNSEEGDLLIVKLKQEIQQEINQEFFNAAGEKVVNGKTLNSEDRLRLAARQGVNLRELVGLSGNKEIMDAISKVLLEREYVAEDGEVKTAGIAIERSGDIVAIDDGGNEFLATMLVMVKEGFRGEFIADVKGRIEAETLKKGDEAKTVYVAAKKVEDKLDTESQIVIAGIGERIARRVRLVFRDDELLRHETELERKGIIAARKKSEVQRAREAYEKRIRRYIEDEAEARAGIVEALAVLGEPDYHKVIEAVHLATEVDYGKSANMKETKRLIDIAGLKKSEFEEKYTPLESKQSLVESMLSEEEVAEITKAALAATLKAIEENLGIELTADDEIKHLKSISSDYLQTFVTEAAAIKKVNQLVSLKNNNVDMREVRDLLEVDVVRVNKERYRQLERMYKEIATSRNQKLAEGEVQGIFASLEVSYSLSEEEKASMKSEVMEEINKEISDSYILKTKVEVPETKAGEKEDLDLISYTADEIRTSKSIFSTGNELAGVRAKKNKGLTLWGIIKGLFTGEANV